MTLPIERARTRRPGQTPPGPCADVVADQPFPEHGTGHAAGARDAAEGRNDTYAGWGASRSPARARTSASAAAKVSTAFR